jgi:hypothetical protein
MRKKYLSLIIGALIALNVAIEPISAASKYPEWQNINGIYYFVNPDGSKATGWIQEGGQWYYLNQDGSCYTGWIKDGNDWYYLSPGGVMGIDTVVDEHYITSIPIGIADIQAYDSRGQDTFDRVYLRIIDLICKLPGDARNAELIRFDQKTSDSWEATINAGYNSFFRTYAGYIMRIYIPEIQDQTKIVWGYVNNYSPQNKDPNIARDKTW